MVVGWGCRGYCLICLIWSLHRVAVLNLFFPCPAQARKGRGTSAVEEDDSYCLDQVNVPVGSSEEPV